MNFVPAVSVREDWSINNPICSVCIPDIRREHMEIKILGSGCENCKKLTEMTKQAAKELDIEAQIEKVSDMQEILKYTVSMPGLVVDDKLRHHGKPLPPLEQIKEFLLTQG